MSLTGRDLSMLQANRERKSVKKLIFFKMYCYLKALCEIRYDITNNSLFTHKAKNISNYISIINVIIELYLL